MFDLTIKYARPWHPINVAIANAVSFPSKEMWRKKNSVTISLVKTEKKPHTFWLLFLWFRVIVDTNQSKRYSTSARRLSVKKSKMKCMCVCVECRCPTRKFKRKMHFHYSIKWSVRRRIISFGRHHGAINHFDSTPNWDVRNDESFLAAEQNWLRKDKWPHRSSLFWFIFI